MNTRIKPSQNPLLALNREGGFSVEHSIEQLNEQQKTELLYSLLNTKNSKDKIFFSSKIVTVEQQQIEDFLQSLELDLKNFNEYNEERQELTVLMLEKNLLTNLFIFEEFKEKVAFYLNNSETSDGFVSIVKNLFNFELRKMLDIKLWELSTSSKTFSLTHGKKCFDIIKSIRFEPDYAERYASMLKANYNISI